MDKGKENQLKRVFRRIIKNTHEELNREDWSPQAEDIILDAAASEVLKEMTLRVYVKLE